MPQHFVRLCLSDRAVRAAVQQDAVVAGFIVLNDRVACAHLLQYADVVGTHAHSRQFLQQEAAVLADCARHAGLRARTRQRDRLIETLAAAEYLQRIRRERFARLHKMIHPVGIVDIQ